VCNSSSDEGGKESHESSRCGSRAVTRVSFKAPGELQIWQLLFQRGDRKCKELSEEDFLYKRMTSSARGGTTVESLKMRKKAMLSQMNGAYWDA